MKFILSPSKTLDMTTSDNMVQTTPLFPEQTQSLYQLLQGYSREEIRSLMKIKKTLLDETYQTYQDYPDLPTGQALLSYTGLVFKQLDVNHLSDFAIDYLSNHLYILDAMYGLLRPTDIIKPYRLDFKMSLEKNLYDFWSIDEILADEIIVNLASKEYAKMLSKKPDITISFKENKNGKYRTIGTYAKMARGQFLRFCAENKIEEIPRLKQFNNDGYTFNETLSTDHHFVFTRTSK